MKIEVARTTSGAIGKEKREYLTQRNYQTLWGGVMELLASKAVPLKSHWQRNSQMLSGIRES